MQSADIKCFAHSASGGSQSTDTPSPKPPHAFSALEPLHSVCVLHRQSLCRVGGGGLFDMCTWEMIRYVRLQNVLSSMRS